MNTAREQRDREADAMLTKLTDEKLREGLARGRRELRLLDTLEQSDDTGPGPFPASKSYEGWSVKDFERRRLLWEISCHAVEEELQRRGLL
jgi:hypothetical protein